MCGIAGWFGTGNGPDESQIQKSLKNLNRRGPDNAGHFREEGILLCHTRLAIIDTSSAGNQPYTIPGSNCSLIFNGEIFNFIELKQQLEDSGTSFNSHSDTEVLFHLLKRDGLKCLEQLNGFFSFAFYDGRSNEILIARDRMGIKPLYYHTDGNNLTFASELTALISLGVKKEIDIPSLALYFQLTYIPAPYTVLKDVKKLEPGCYITLKKGEKPKTGRYYDLIEKFEGKEISDNPVKELRDLLTDSVRRRLIADVPLGTFLSGGIDSAIITALAQREHSSVSAFTVSFPETPFFDESALASLLAKKHGVKHHILPAEGKDIPQGIEDTLNCLDEPFADSSSIAVNILSRKVRSSIKVALSGDGADELFGGYNKHRAMLRSVEPGITEELIRQTGMIWRNLPSSRSGLWQNKIRQAAKFSVLASLSPEERYWHLAAFSDPFFVRSLLRTRDEKEEDNRRSYLLRSFNPLSPIESGLLTDMMMVLPNDMLTKTDRMSMCHSLEVRVPFLDHRIAELALKIPVSQKINRNKGKLILRKTFGDLLPDEILSQKKKGFEVPLGKWLREYASDQIEELFSRNRIESQGLLQTEIVWNLKENFLAGNDGQATEVWQMLVFQRWYQQNMEE